MSQRKLKKIRKQEESLAARVVESIKVKSLSIRAVIKENKWFLLLMTVAAILVYANGLNADFVSDDYATILNNPELMTWKYAFQGGATTYFINALTAKIFGVSPLPFHLLSVLIFVATCWLAFIFLEYLFEKKIAMLSMSLFVLHPIHVEAVTWISGKPYLLIAFYILVAMLCFIKFLEKQNLWYLVGSGAAFIMGFLTDNPRPFSLFPIALLFLFLTKIDVRKNKWFKYWPFFLLIVGAVMIYAWPHIVSRISIVNSGYNTSESIFYDPTFQYPTGLTKYFQLLWLPIDLTLYHTMFVFPVWLNWLVFLTYLTMLVYFGIRDRRYFFALAFIFVAVFPSMSPVKVSWLVAERYMYLGSLGFCLFLGLILNDIGSKFKYLSSFLLVCLMVFYSVRLFSRNIDWQTNHRLWVNTCQVSPNSHNAWNNIGDDYDKLKQYDNAIKGFSQSTLVKPNYADAFHNRANIFFKMGRLDLARDSYNTALYFSPGLFQTYLSLVQIDLNERKFDLALQHAEGAVKIAPNDPQSAYVLAIVYSQMGQIENSKSILEKIVQAYPNYSLAVAALAQINALPKK